nr:DUF561 domain-containing protein [Tanacetum cinerariifolium]
MRKSRTYKGKPIEYSGGFGLCLITYECYMQVEIGNYDSFYDAGITFSPEQILSLTMETRRLLPLVTLSVTVPHTLSLPDQTKLAELLEQEGVDIIQTEGGKCSNPSKSGVLGLIEKASPTLAAAYSISRAVKIPVMCASGLSAITAPMAITAGAAGVGVGSAINKLNDVVAMIAEKMDMRYMENYGSWGPGWSTNWPARTLEHRASMEAYKKVHEETVRSGLRMKIVQQSMEMDMWDIKEKLAERREQMAIRAYEEDKRREEWIQKIKEDKRCEE